MSAKLYATNRLKDYREAKGYTQNEMVALVSIEMDKDFAMSTYQKWEQGTLNLTCLLYTSPSPRDRTRSRMPSSA